MGPERYVTCMFGRRLERRCTNILIHLSQTHSWVLAFIPYSSTTHRMAVFCIIFCTSRLKCVNSGNVAHIGLISHLHVWHIIPLNTWLLLPWLSTSNELKKKYFNNIIFVNIIYYYFVESLNICYCAFKTKLYSMSHLK